MNTAHKRIDDYILHDGIRPYHAIDFTIECNPSLRTKSHTLKGVKVYTEYLGQNSNELVVKKTFIEDYANRVINILIEWFDSDGNVFSSKTKQVYLEDARWFERFEKQRKVAFSDLKAQVTAAGYGQYVDILYSFFKEELQDFYETGSDLFTKKILEIKAINTSSLSSDNLLKITNQILNSKLGNSPNYIYEVLISVMI